VIAALTAADIANAIRMLRTQYAGAVLIVEGGSDARVYGRFCHSHECRVIPAFGRENAETVLTTLEGEGIEGIVAILDKDFSGIIGPRHPSENIVLTDVHDVEGLLLASSALERVLAEFGSEEKLRGKDVRRILLTGGERIGCLRLLSIKDGLNLTFEGLTFGAFVKSDDLDVDIPRLVRTVKNKSRAHQVADQDIVQKVESLIGRHEAWDVACGHDLIEILCIGVRKFLGSCKAVVSVPEILARSLRLAYEASHFTVTRMYASIKEWEARNRPYVILAV
jgi:hypothetical protein